MKNAFRITWCATAWYAGLLLASLPAQTPSAEDRANALLQQFTLEEKVDYLSGVNGFSIRALPRLNLPEIRMADGPMGVRGNSQTSPSTAYPAGVGMAASWNRELATRIGAAMGRDCRARVLIFSWHRG